MTLVPAAYGPAPWDRTNPSAWVDSNPAVGPQLWSMISQLHSTVPTLSRYDTYLEGEQSLSYMSKLMQTEASEYLQAVVLNWCRLVVDAYVARMSIQGFRYAGDEQTDKDLWVEWQKSGLDALAVQAIYEAVGLGRSYIAVGSDGGGGQTITVESPFQTFARRDPRTRKVVDGVKLWQDTDGVNMSTKYEPNRTVIFQFIRGQWVPVDVDQHNVGVPALVPLVNRPRITRPNGISEFHDVIPIVDGAIKTATDMMSSVENHAIPRRWIFGVKNSDFVDADGKKVSAWSRIAGRIWSHPEKDVTAGQFPEANLTNFHETIKLFAGLASQVAALPANYLAFNAVNPSSADAMRAIDAQLELRVKRKFIDFGEAFEDVMRLVLRLKTGSWDPRADSLETVWADPGTPTVAQKADAIVKLVQAKVIPVEQAREDLGYGPIARDRMAEMDERAATDPAINRLVNGITGGAA